MKNKGILRGAAFVLAAVLAGGLPGISAEAQELPDNSFTEEEQAYIESGKILKVGYVRDRKPVSFQGENGELAGVSRYIFDRISEISGLHFEYVELPAGDVTYDYLLNEGFDLVTGVEYNKENQAARGILMSDPYLSSRKVIVAKEGLNFKADAHLTVAISTGSQTIKKVIGGQYPNFKLVDYDSMEDCLNAVSRGEADLLIQNQYVAEYWLYKPYYHDLMVIPVLELADQLCFSAVTPLEKEESREWREKELQISILNKSIAQISYAEVSGYVIASVTENMYEYTVGDFVYQYRYTLILMGAALVMICILVGAAMHARFRAVKARADAKAKSDFLSAMSHEIRTPLNGLISLNYLMSQNVDDKEKMVSYLRQSSTVSQYLLSLVNNVLDMSRLQDGEMKLEQKPVDLELLLAAVESVEKGGMEEKGIDFRIEGKLTWPGILGDSARIQQILLNLLDNAHKYTKHGDSVTLEVGQTENGEGSIITRIRVRDTGRGMSEEFQKEIFRPFTQERETVSQGNQGTGLGLSICALLAQRMGGSLSVESRPGEGSCFTFLFPARPAALAGEAVFVKDGAEDNGPNSLPKVLIAEDNELNGQILVELLEGEGYQVIHVLNGKKAVEVFEASGPGEYSVILMDLLMPEMNGYEAARKIRGLDRPDAGTVRIFACTANTFQEDREQAFRSGMNDFIAKPINMKELLKKLQS